MKTHVSLRVLLGTAFALAAFSSSAKAQRPTVVTPGSFGHPVGGGGNAAGPIAVAPGWFDRGSKLPADPHSVTPAMPLSGIHRNANLVQMPKSGRSGRGGSGGSGRGGGRGASHAKAVAHKPAARR
jgi:hypothetical protein